MLPEATLPRVTTIKRAIGLIELRSIARGMLTTDTLLKAGEVELLRAHVVCPGKYIILVAGTISQVNAAIEAGQQVAPEVVVDHFVLPNVHPSIFPALTATTEIEVVKAVGVIETFTLAASIVAADVAVKAAPLQLLEIRLPFAMGGKAFAVVTGEVSAVRSGVNAAVAALKDEGVLDSFAVIPSPHKDLIAKLL
ncbi:MAG TPA: BMC domain-containing protein [Anaerolineales bacterium]|nr:BMC domain-containing protein [Anaerolineales bacterium]